MNNIENCLNSCVYIINDNINEISKFIMSVNTLLKFHKIKKLYIFYDMEDKDISNYVNNLNYQKHNENIEVICKKINIKLFNYFNLGNNLIDYNLYNLFISSLIEDDNYIYINNNILFSENIYNVFNDNIDNSTLLFGFNDKIYLDAPNDFGNYFFNKNMIGVEILYINSKLYNQMNILDDIVEYFRQNYQNIDNILLSCYNYIFIKYSKICNIKYSSNYNRCIADPKKLMNEWEYIHLFNFNNKNAIFMNTIYDLILKK